MRRKWKNRLGVSTVIANMLMILITMSLAAILVAWAGTSFGAFSSGSQLFFAQRGQALQERFVVEVVFFNTTNHYIYVFVRNVGLTDFKLSAIYLNGNAITATCSASWQCLGKSSATNLDLPVQQVVELPLNYGTSWTSGTVFTIVVASSRGNQAVATARGP
jgi:FlaG/FlaF family flagellin (archaellin)